MFSVFLDSSASVFHPLPRVLAVKPGCSSKERKEWEFLTRSLPHAGVKGAQVRSRFCPGEEAHLLPQRGKSERGRARGSAALGSSQASRGPQRPTCTLTWSVTVIELRSQCLGATLLIWGHGVTGHPRA